MASFEDIKRDQASATEAVPAGTIQAFGGTVAPSGWHLCDGTVLEQADYSRLFANIGANWDTFAHPVDGAPTVGGSQFALPNLKGLYLAGSGDAGGDARSLGTFQADKTSVNGLATQNDTHSHTGASGMGVLNALRWDGVGVSYNFVRSTPNSGSTITANDTHNHTLTGDNETRPVTAPVNYIIKL